MNAPDPNGVDRRQFIVGTVAAASGVVALWGSWPWLPGLFHTEGVYAYPKRTELWKGVDVVYSTCRQCRSDCGNAARVFNGVLLKLDGNPYDPNATEPHLDYATPPETALTFRHAHSLCPRGNAGVQTVYDPYRVYFPLKRVGPRGAGKFKMIGWDQLIEEVTNGGLLFKDVPGEESRHVEGFKDLWKGGEGPNTPVDPKHPDLGPITNQLVVYWGRAEPGQSDFLERFATAFGSVNTIPHVSICELSHHVATRRVFDGHMNMVKPDFMNSEYVMLFGLSLFGANFPAQTYWRKVAHAFAEGPLQKLVVIDVAAPNGAKVASEYVKVIPGSDGALVIGMIRHIMENHWYSADYLSYPTHAAAAAAGEPNHSNATWLVVQDPKHPLYRKHLTAEAAGLGKGADPVVFDAATGKAAVAVGTGVKRATLWPSGPLSSEPATVNGVACRTGFQILWQEAASKTIPQYAEIAGIPEETITRLAREFTSHGRKAVTDFYRGAVMHSNGYYTGLAILTLNVLVGNVDYVGGTITGGPTPDHMGGYEGAPYQLKKLPGEKQRTVPEGVTISREGSFYEETSLYKEAVAKGKSPFPAPRPWYPFGFGIWQELFAGMWYQYPYPVKILFQHMANPVYSAPPGMSGAPNDENLANVRLLKDLKKIPLYITDDIVISETSVYADYVVPDTTYVEAWGMLHSWPISPTGRFNVRQPVIEPLTAKTPSGEPMCFEQFLIDVAKKLGLPGFGQNAFLEGGDLDVREDFYLKAVANAAYDRSYLKRQGDRLAGTGPVPDASSPLEAKAIERWKPRYGRALTEAQWAKVGYVLARGGRFEDYNVGYEPGQGAAPVLATHRYGGKKLPCHIYDPVVATTHNALTGELFSGTAKYDEIRFMDGTAYASVDKADKYPFWLSTYKQAIHTHSRTHSNYWLAELMPQSFAEFNPMDARKLGLQDGDWVRISSATYPKGIIGPARVLPGVRPGVVTFAHSFGHWHYDSGSWTIDGKTYQGDAYLNGQSRFNPVMRLDPSLTDSSGWGTCAECPVGGSASYYDTRVKVERVPAPAETLLRSTLQRA